MEENKQYLHLKVGHVILGLNMYKGLRLNIYNHYFANNGNCNYYLYLSKNKEYFLIMVNHFGIIDGYQKVIDEKWFKNYM